MFFKVIGVILIVLNALYLGFLGILLMIAIFQASLAAGLVLALTSIGFMLCFPGAAVGFSSLGWFEILDNAHNKFELWLKAIGLFIASIVGSWVTYWIGSWIVVVIIRLVV